MKCWLGCGLLVVTLASGEVMAEKDPERICGSAKHEIELMRAGGGDSKRGAVVLARQQLKRDDKTLPPSDLRRVTDRFELVDALQRVDEQKEADALLDEALKLAQHVPQDEALANQLYNQGLGLLWRKQFGRADAVFAWALKIVEPTQGRDLGKLLESRGESLLGLGRAPEAEAALSRALKLGRQQKSLGTIGGGFLLQKLGAALAAQGKLETADRAYRDGAAEVAAVLGEDNPHVLRIRDEHAQALRRLGHPDEAAAIERPLLPNLRAAWQRAKQDASMASLATEMKQRLDEVSARLGAR